MNNYSFDILIIEYNANFGPTEDKTVIYDQNFVWDETDYVGASLTALVNVCKSYGYTLVYCTQAGVNAYFINNRHLPKIHLGNKDAIFRPPQYGNVCFYGGYTPDPLKRKFAKSTNIE